MELFVFILGLFQGFEIKIKEFITNNVLASLENPSSIMGSNIVSSTNNLWMDKDDTYFLSDENKNCLNDIKNSNTKLKQTNNPNSSYRVDTHTGNKADKYIWKSLSNNKLYSKITFNNGMDIEIPKYAKPKDNYNMFKYIENKHSTRLSNVKLNFLK